MKLLWIVALLVAPAFAQDDLRDRFDTVAASASAWMQSADSIEWRLNQEGAALHPQIAALRARIAAALDQAHDAIEHDNPKSADRALKLAEALTERLARKLGG
jgi:ElaB/YqjD/DUF883 family membrane-anchored ribosome-binding protein